MYSIARESAMVWLFMMRSMLADQPNLEVTSATGESASRLLTTTFSTLSPSVRLMKSVTGFSSFSASSVLALSSSSSPSCRSSFVTSTRSWLSNLARLVATTSSMGSVRYSTS